MRSDKPLKTALALIGALMAATGALGLVVAASAHFSMGRTAFAVNALSFIVIAMPLIAFAYSRRLAKVLGVVILLGFSAAMIWLTFFTAMPVKDPMMYQVAAIALAVLLVARVGLAFRGTRNARR